MTSICVPLQTLTESRRGAWVINITKHLLDHDQTDHHLTALENLLFAGKCGSLLIKLSADETEQLTLARVKSHARLCAIAPAELDVYLQALIARGCLAPNRDGTVYEVLSFSRTRVLVTTWRILDGLIASGLEKTLPDILEYCLVRPRFESELLGCFSSLTNEEADVAISVIRAFDLLGFLTPEGSTEPLYFNEYQFGHRIRDIATALNALPPAERDDLNEMLEVIHSRPGALYESLPGSERVKSIAVGLGLVDISEVASPGGKASFITPPGFATPSVGPEASHLEDDVFHHAKMLLSSLRFGEVKSRFSRGRILYPSTLVSALINRDRIGPCTAIGEDYAILEAEGIVRTVRADRLRGDQFYMELRRHEPAEMVLSLLSSGKSEVIDAKSVQGSLQLPLEYSGPEAQRGAVRRTRTTDPRLMHRFLTALRT